MALNSIPSKSMSSGWHHSTIFPVRKKKGNVKKTFNRYLSRAYPRGRTPGSSELSILAPWSKVEECYLQPAPPPAPPPTPINLEPLKFSSLEPLLVLELNPSRHVYVKCRTQIHTSIQVCIACVILQLTFSFYPV